MRNEWDGARTTTVNRDILVKHAWQPAQERFRLDAPQHDSLRTIPEESPLKDDDVARLSAQRQF